MLSIIVPETELYDENTEEFTFVKETKLVLEYSLVAISKWESKWKIPFLESEEKTIEQMIDLVRCMTITQNVKPDVYKAISMDILQEVINYIGDPMTATTFSNTQHNAKNAEKVTSELIYYWMTALQIPMECQKWHLNRLMVLIRVANEKNQPPKKMSKADIFRQNKALNAQRRAKFKTRG